MGLNYPNPIYMYPRRKKRPQCNKCKYKIGNLCYQRKYREYNYAELEGTTKRKCSYFECKQNNHSLRKKEIEKLRHSFKEPKKPKSTQREKRNWAIFYTLITLILVVMGYLKSFVYYFGAIIFGVCAFYWITK